MSIKTSYNSPWERDIKIYLQLLNIFSFYFDIYSLFQLLVNTLESYKFIDFCRQALKPLLIQNFFCKNKGMRAKEIT